jgi:hypothetical protein
LKLKEFKFRLIVVGMIIKGLARTMTSEIKEDAAGPYIEQRLSALVRARILFKREIEIDRGGKEINFDKDYLLRIVDRKRDVDAQMYKILTSAAGATLLIYLVGRGVDPTIPVWGVKLLAIPGVLIFLTAFASYALVMASIFFFNSQTYAALIDQVILQNSKDGVIDVDMIKAGYESEWLIFKVLQKEFSFYAPVHIEFKSWGSFFSRAIFVLISLVAIAPFIAIIIALPALAVTFLPSDTLGFATKALSILCATLVLILTIVANLEFKCVVRLGKGSGA